MNAKESLPITLDRERHLRFDYNAFCLIEQTAGSDCMSEAFWDSITPVKIRALFYGALKWEDQKLTLDRVGDFIGEALKAGRLDELIGAALKAYALAFPASEPANQE